MFALNYRGRVHRNKFSGRTLRYMINDQLVRLCPALGRRWLFPTEAVPIEDVAAGVERYPVRAISASKPDVVARIAHRDRDRRCHEQHVYHLRNVVLTGQVGALQKDGRLLAERSRPNWAIALRARRHHLRRLDDQWLYYHLLVPIPATGHVFHWLYDAIVPFLSWLCLREGREPVRPIVNARLTDFQRGSIAFVQERFGLGDPVPIAGDEALAVPRLARSVFKPDKISAQQATDGLAMLDPLADFLSGQNGAPANRRRLYISRDDAKLRRVANEQHVMALLAPLGFERVILKGRPVAEQVGLFREAEAVVAPHGAGLTHVSWCRPGTHLLEFFPSPSGRRGYPRNATANFWRIAGQRGLRYHAFEAGPPLDRHDLFEIPEPVLQSALRHLAQPAGPSAG